MATEAVNVVVLKRGQHRWIFLYDDFHLNEMLRTLGRFASDNESDFTWNDAACVAKKIQNLSIGEP